MKKLTVVVTRGSQIESAHNVHVVLMNAQQKITEQFGDADKKVFPRSAIKMLQALAFLKTGAPQKLNLKAEHVAFASSSHSGETVHIALAQDWLRSLNFTEQNLICGAHMPFGEAAAHTLIRQNQSPTRLHNNCSGKHCGLLSAIKTQGWSAENYGDFNHPLQKLLRDILSEKSGFDLHKADWGTDGCGIPTYQMPLSSISRAMTEFLQSSESAQSVTESILKNPILFSGESAFCTQLIQKTKQDLIIKTGAEGTACGVFLKSQLVFALKVDDGTLRAAEAVSLYLANKYAGCNLPLPIIKTWLGQEVGKLIVTESDLH